MIISTFNRTTENACFINIRSFLKPLKEISLLDLFNDFINKMINLTNSTINTSSVLTKNIQINFKNMIISLNNTKLTENVTIGQLFDKFFTISKVTSEQVLSLLR